MEIRFLLIMLSMRLLDTNSAICYIVVKRNVPYIIIDREIVHTDRGFRSVDMLIM